MTELLFYSNPDLLEFTAGVVSAAKDKKGTALVLDSTAFYPEGGGQPADRGSINGLSVVDVKKDDGLVYHYVEAGGDGKMPEAGDEVQCIVDYEHRFDYMQQHTGQHLISAAMMKTAEIATVSVHQGEQWVAVETSAEELDRGLMLEIEAEANRSIRANTPIESIWTDADGLADYKLRRPSKHSTNIRIINIPGTDCVACGGMHLKNTVETGLIKYSHQEKIRGHVRTFWKIGNRAYRDFEEKTAIINSLNELYSSRQFELVEKIKASADSYADLKYSYGRLEEDSASSYALVLLSEAEKTTAAGSLPVVIKVLDNRSKGFVTSLLKSLGSRNGTGPSFIFNRTDTALTWAVAAPEDAGFDFNAFKTDFLPLIDGKGGGRAPLWQGAGRNPDGLEQLINRLKESWM